MSNPERLKAVSIKAQLVEHIRADLRLAIETGELRPGEFITERGLQKKYPHSIASIRGAVGCLEYENVVVRVPQKGAQIVNFTQREIEDRTDVRVALEPLAFLRAQPRLSESDYQQLEAFCDAIGTNPQADHEFHKLIWARAGSDVLEKDLVQTVSPLFSIVYLVRALFQNQAERLDAHRVLIAALRTGNKDQIRREVEAHAASAFAKIRGSEWPDARALFDAVHQQKTLGSQKRRTN